MTRNYITQTAISYRINGDNVKVVRFDLADDQNTYDSVKDEYAAKSDDGYAHVRQDNLYAASDIARYVDTNFFDVATMRFFNSRVLGSRVVGNAIYFVTSERMDYGTPRKYTVRVFRGGTFGYADGTGLGDFLTSQAANKFLANLSETVSLPDIR